MSDFFKTSSNIEGFLKLNNDYNIKPIKKTKIIFKPINNEESEKKSINNKSKDKVKLIKSILNEPSIKQPYDGLAILMKKDTTEYLLKKSCEKEKKVIFEKNKLLKSNYPLIEILSNRKVNNNTNKLIRQILSSTYGKLKKSSKSYEKNRQKLSKANRNIVSEKFLMKFKTPKSQKEKIFYNQKRIHLNNYFDIIYLKDKPNLTQRFFNINDYSSKNRILSKSLKELMNYNNNRPETEVEYPILGYCETMRLDNHKNSKRNNDILLNRTLRKRYMNYKNKEKDFIKNEILNDASKLKLNNKIMPLSSRIIAL
jgi:hypothetical protein